MFFTSCTFWTFCNFWIFLNFWIFCTLWIFCCFFWRGGRPLVISHKCWFISWLFLAPRPPMHFLHKSFPGTSDKIYHCAKFHSSSCLFSWFFFPNIRSFRCSNWESTLFCQNLAVLNLSFTVNKLYTWLTHPKQLCCMPAMSLVSWTGLWCPRQKRKQSNWLMWNSTM